MGIKDVAKEICATTGEDPDKVAKELAKAVKDRRDIYPSRPLDKRQNQLLWAYDRNVK